MNKPFVIINVVEGSVAVVYLKDSEEEALELAVSMTKEQCDESEEEIRRQLKADWLFVPPSKGFEVCIKHPSN